MIKFSKISLVLPPSKYFTTIICVPNFVASNYQKVTDVSPIYDVCSFRFRFILVCFESLEPCPLKILDTRLTHVVEETKMLIELTVIDSNHFIRYKCKTTHYLDS